MPAEVHLHQGGEDALQRRGDSLLTLEARSKFMASSDSQHQQYTGSSSGIKGGPPAFFCAQQSPHRVQSSTNLDLVDCVGSDLLLAMNCLDVGENGGRGGAGHGSSSEHNNESLDRFSGGGSGSNDSINGADLPSHVVTPSPPGGEFLPLAALAPPPTRRPAWITAQQQQARVQNEHFPSRIYGGECLQRTGSAPAGGCGGSTDVESAADDRRSEHSAFGGACSLIGGRGRSDDVHILEYSSSLRGSPGAGGMGSVAGFGSGGGGGGNQGLDQPQGGFSEQGSSSRGPSPGARRPSSEGRVTPHLDDSWTAVLNSPGGSELMEFLTEQASRALVLWNVEAIPKDILRAACEVHGPLYYLRAEHRQKRVVFLAYYDVRDAVSAHQSLGRELSQQAFAEATRPPPAVHFSVELHAGFSYKEGSLVVHDLPSQATEAEVGSVFQMYGDLRGVSRHPSAHQGHPASFVVEFCSIQDARIAAQELTVRNPWGHAITVEPAVRSESERLLGRQLHSTLNRWTAEATQAKAAAQASAMFHEQQNQHGGVFPGDDRMRSSSSVPMSGRSSDSDSPPPKAEDYARDVVYMESYTPMTSANTTPATTPGSTPPSGADSYHYAAGSRGGKSPGMQKQHYMSMPPFQQQHHYENNGNNSSGRMQHRMGSASPSIISPGSTISISTTPGSTSMHGGSSPGSHQLYSSPSGANCGSAGGGPPPPHHSHMGVGGSSGHHHHHLAPRMPTSQHMHDQHLPSSSSHNGSSNGKPHPLSSSSPGPYRSSPGPGSSAGGGGYFMDISPEYHGDCDNDRTPTTPMWPSSSLSPPSGRAGGGGGSMSRGSPPLRGGMSSNGILSGMMGCHGMGGGGGTIHPGGPGGLGYKSDRARQSSLDEGRLSGGGGGGMRNMRCNSDGAQMLVSPGCGGGNGGDEFSLDLKKVSKGLDKRTTIMIRNIPNKYTQAMLLQEIDASYRGAYDFFYLPIDFKNKCNVGYAFINFMDYRRIVAFFREFNAQRWKNFNSEKVCAISYARIQGKASMISRFQNSSLMEKDGEYRPLIFHSTGAERGRPEPFPASSKVFRGTPVPLAGNGMGMGGFGGIRDRERSISSSSSMV